MPKVVQLSPISGVILLLLSAGITQSSPAARSRTEQHQQDAVILNYDAGDHQHVQTGEPGKAVHGIYSYTGPDGKRMTTHYAADDQGYRVEYDVNHHQHKQTPVVVEQANIKGKEPSSPSKVIDQQEEKKVAEKEKTEGTASSSSKPDVATLLRHLLDYVYPAVQPASPYGYNPYYSPGLHHFGGDYMNTYAASYFKESGDISVDAESYPPGLYPIEVTYYDDVAAEEDNNEPASPINPKTEGSTDSAGSSSSALSPAEDRKIDKLIKKKIILTTWATIATINALKLILSKGLIG